MRHYIDALISYLEAAGAIRVVRDEDGRPIETQIIRLSGVMEGGAPWGADLEVGGGEPHEADQDRTNEGL